MKHAVCAFAPFRLLAVTSLEPLSRLVGLQVYTGDRR